MPTSSFAPELFELYKAGARKPILVPIQDKKRAIHLRFRLHNLRKEMRKEGHVLTTIANGVSFSITPDGDLLARPVDDQFVNELRAAGITVEVPVASAPSLNLSDTLKGFYNLGKEKG